MYWMMHYGIQLAHPATFSLPATANAVPVIIAAMVFIVGLTGLSMRRSENHSDDRKSA